MRLGLRVFVFATFTLLWIPTTGLSDQAYHLFFIERNKNKNIVQYDFCPGKVANPNGGGPVVAYWIMESGERRELSPIQRELAFGIASQKELAVDRYEIVLKAFRERKIIVRKTPEGYKAFGTIDGREGVLEKIYVECRERWLCLPQVLFVDVFGRDKETNLPITERILPE